MSIPIREVSRAERPALVSHFLLLGPGDRRLRFGTPLSDYSVREYVERIDFAHDAVFAVADDDLRFPGIAHLARGGGHAELGVSVLQDHRGHGLGGALLERAHLHARNWGVHALFMHCLTENAAIMRLARRQQMEIVSEAGEADAWLRLPPPDAASHFGAVFAQRVALLDHALKSQLAATRRIAVAVTSGTRSRDRER
jgi:GNAT superfamily N-acetyltransferase